METNKPLNIIPMDSYNFESPAHQARHAQMQRLLRAPVSEGGMGLNEAQAQTAIITASDSACKVLYSLGSKPSLVSYEYFQLIVWQQIYHVYSTKKYSWDKEMQNAGADTMGLRAEQYDRYYQRAEGDWQQSYLQRKLMSVTQHIKDGLTIDGES